MKTFEDYSSDILYAISIKKDTTYLCLHFTKDHNGTRFNTPYPEKIYTPYSSYSNKIFWKISNVVPTPRNPRYAETATYDKIWYDEDVHDLRFVETEFPAIVFNDELTSEKALSCEPMISSLNNNEIDFRISFDESNDEDYTVIFDKNLFSYKIISVNDLKMDSENDNEKVNMPSFPSPEPKVSYFDDLDFLKDFENEFLAIVYNDALLSKSDSSTEPVEIHHRIDEFDLKDETSLSKYDEKEQNVLYFNDLFPFNIIYPDKDNVDNEIVIIQSSRDLAGKKSSTLISPLVFVKVCKLWDEREVDRYGNANLVSIKEDMAYLCLHFTKDHKGTRFNTPYTPAYIQKKRVRTYQSTTQQGLGQLAQEAAHYRYHDALRTDSTRRALESRNIFTDHYPSASTCTHMSDVREDDSTESVISGALSLETRSEFWRAAN
ncbi:hypothetical protein Tco_1033885, partial [Tanacetum coccineum]